MDEKRKAGAVQALAAGELALSAKRCLALGTRRNGGAGAPAGLRTARTPPGAELALTANDLRVAHPDGDLVAVARRRAHGAERHGRLSVQGRASSLARCWTGHGISVVSEAAERWAGVLHAAQRPVAVGGGTAPLARGRAEAGTLLSKI